MAVTQSPHGDSRPGTSQSDASFATALEQPISPHPVGSVAYGLDHIISLIGRPQHAAHRRSGSTASQASLDRTAHLNNLPQGRLLHELELLKRLAQYDRQSVPTPAASVLDIDVNATQQDLEAFNEDPELAKAREKLLLQAAVRRVNGLTTENTSLQEMLRSHEGDFETVRAQKEIADASLLSAQISITELQEQLRQLQQSSQEQLGLIEKLRLEKQRSDSAHEDARSSKSVIGSLQDKITKSSIPVLFHSTADQEQDDTRRRKSKGKPQERSRSAAPKSGRSSAVNLDIEKQLAEVELLLIDLEGKKARNDALAKQVEEYQSKVAAITREKEALETEASETQAKHAQAIQEVHDHYQAEGKMSSSAAVEDVTSLHTRAFEDQKTAHNQELERLRIEHAEQVSQMNKDFSLRLETNEEELQMRKGKENLLERRVQELSEVLDARNVSPARSIESLNADSREEKAGELDRRSGQAEVRNLKKRHQEAIAQIRATAQRQLDNQRVELEKRHEAALASAVADVHGAAENQSSEESARYQSEISRLDGEHRLRLAELETKHQEKITYELLLKEDAIKSEMKALQDRLDASLTGQAEAERSIALFRQQKFEADKRLSEAEVSFKKQIENNQREKDALTEQLKQLQTSVQELEQKSSDDSNTSTVNNHKELSTVKVQLGNLEKSRAETQALWQKALEEKSELVRQNDFLVKELEALLTQRSKPRVTPTNRRDASVQTDNWPAEPKANLLEMQAWKADRSNAQEPLTPLSPTYKEVQDEIETAWKTRTFEEYFSQANDEASELERVTSSNQTLFAEKLHEHLSDMQQARHRIAVDYQAKLNSLASEKDKMDKMVTSSHIIMFTEERAKLTEQYGMNDADIQGSPDAQGDDAIEMYAAEQKLVQEFDRRLVERKSQIALQYAAKFQAMTQEYDQEIARVLRDGRSPGLHIPSSEHGSPRSSRLHRMASENDISRPPPVTPDGRSARGTSLPRTSTSIPRAVMYPGNRHSPDATSQPRSMSKAHRNWNSVAQHSLMRAKSPAGMLTTPTSVKSDKSSDSKSVSSPLREKSSPPEEQNDSPIQVPRPSMESSIPRPGIPTRAKERQSISMMAPLRASSKRLSSAMIYSQAPRQSISNAS